MSDLVVYEPSTMARAIIAAPAVKERLLVAALDFGTTYSGYAYSFRADFLEDPLKIVTNQWQFGSSRTVAMKTPSCILFNSRRQCDSFGFEAENKYAELCLEDAHHEWFFFRHFKMLLYGNKNLTRETIVEDDKGLTMPAMTVFSESIRCLVDHMITECNRRNEDNEYDMHQQRSFSDEDKRMQRVERDDIFWVLTVPAIWDDSAKQFMREAAVNAGIDTYKLCLALEPEAASLTCRYLRVNVDRGQQRDSDTMIAFSPGTKYLVLDAGGGTVDITVHEVQGDGNVKELYKANGGPWGGKSVNDAFLQFLTDVIGRDTVKQFEEKHRDDFFDLLRDFELKKKTIKPQMDDKITFKIPIALHETYREVNRRDFSRNLMANQDLSQAVTFAGDKLRIQPEKVKALFTETCDQIVGHLKTIFRLPEVQGVGTILMVGGFSESPILQEMIRRKFTNKKVIIPIDASLAVLKGAVIYGHHPTAIVSRVSKFTYGIQVYTTFQPGVHDEFRKVIIDGVAKCKGVFDKHVEIGEKVEEGTSFGEKTYVPAWRSGTSICLNVFTSEEKTPTYIDGCTKLGGLNVDLTDPKIVTYEDKEILVKMIYGGTELGVEAKVVKTGKVVDAKFDFLG